MARSSLIRNVALVFAVLSVTDPLSIRGVSAVSQDTPPDGEFELKSYRDVLAVVGEEAQLWCHLPDGAKYVSWIAPDGFRLTAWRRLDDVTYGPLVTKPFANSQLLKILNAQESYSGVYLCMVDNDPNYLCSRNLTVVERVPTILWEPFRVHPQGHTLNLTCEINPPAEVDIDDLVLWMRDGQDVRNSTDGRYTITTTNTTSRLLIQDAQPMDSGNYTCKLTSGSSDSVDVDVLQDLYGTVSGSQRPLAVVLGAGSLVLAVAVTAFGNLYW